jgi:DNA polymerase-3 subunit delta'
MKKLPYPWLSGAWDRWRAHADRHAHAILVNAPAGVGAMEFAAYAAQSTLCESAVPAERPCGACPACGWFEVGNHPDFRMVMPESMRPEPDPESTEQEGDDAPAAARSAPSKVIKISQIKQLDGFFGVGTHRGGPRVVLIHPCETLTVDAASRLLKTLEEPPDASLILCVTHRADRVLPTLRSRCTRIDLGFPPAAQAADWLAAEGVAEAQRALAESGGAPLLAKEQQDTAELRGALIQALASPERFDPIGVAERCEKGGAPAVCLWVSRWLADLAACGHGGKVRYHPQSTQAIERIAKSVPAAILDGLYRRVLDRRRAADHPLNPRLFLEDLFIDYARTTAR